MRGENDDHLTWPYKGTITMTLLKQLEDNGHLTRTLGLGNSVEHKDTVKPIGLMKSGIALDVNISLLQAESSTAHRQYLIK